MKCQDTIIILNCTKFSEHGLILHTLSRNCGRKSFLVRNAARLTGYFQPLNILECEISDNPKSSLQCASSFREVHPLIGIRRNPGKNAISMFIAEVLYRGIHEGYEDEGLFDWAGKEILLLEEINSDFSNFHIGFLLDFASAMGFKATLEGLLPFLDDCTGDACSFLGCSRADSMLIPLNGKRRTEICRRFLKYLEFHLESPLNIRSLDVLSELF